MKSILNIVLKIMNIIDCFKSLTLFFPIESLSYFSIVFPILVLWVIKPVKTYKINLIHFHGF